MDRRDIVSWDSQHISTAEGYQVKKAAELAQEGKSVKEILPDLDDVRARSITLVALNDPSHVVNGGRGRELAHIITSVLSLKPIVEVRNSKVKPIKIGRSMDRLITDMKTAAIILNPEKVSVMHGGDEKYIQLAEDLAKKLATDLNMEYGKAISVCYAGLTLATHAGPEAVGIGILSRKPIPEKVLFQSKD